VGLITTWDRLPCGGTIFLWERLPCGGTIFLWERLPCGSTIFLWERLPAAMVASPLRVQCPLKYRPNCDRVIGYLSGGALLLAIPCRSC